MLGKGHDLAPCAWVTMRDLELGASVDGDCVQRRDQHGTVRSFSLALTTLTCGS